jgi:hypothetical protein
MPKEITLRQIGRRTAEIDKLKKALNGTKDECEGWRVSGSSTRRGKIICLARRETASQAK